MKAFSGGPITRPLERKHDQRTVRVITNGVTGRIGYRQHLVRPLLAIRGAASVFRTVIASRSTRSLSGATRRSSPPSPHSTGCRLHRQSRRGALRWLGFDLLRRTGHLGAEEVDPEGHRRRKAHLHRRADRRVGHRGHRARHRRPPGRRDQRRGARQALPAGPGQAETPDRLRILRTDPLGPRGVRLMGLDVISCPRSGRAGTTWRRTAA